MNLRAVFWLLGCVLLILAGLLLVPAGVSAWYGEEAALRGCLISALVTAVAGGVLARSLRGSSPFGEGHIDYFRREGLTTVVLAWFLAAVAGALPFLFSGVLVSPVDAFFESASGFTTTGSTILTPEVLDALPQGIAFWRSFSNWLGGVAVVLVFVVLFPTGGRSSFRFEAGGISREAARHRIRENAVGLIRAYAVLTVVEVGLLWFLAGPELEHPLFEAWIHSFASLATGGFTNHSQGVRFLGSWKIELVLVFFMFAAGIHFSIHDTLLRRGWRSAWRMASGSSEIRAFALLIVGATLLISLVLWFWGGSNGDPSSELPNYAHLSRALRDGLFAVVSMQTSTGLRTADFDAWPDFCRMLLMLLAMIGACAGSTGGGLKIVRFLVLSRAALQSVQRFAWPRALCTVRVDRRALDERTVAMIMGYCGLWFLVFGIGTLAVASMLDPPAGVHQHELLTAATSVLATLNNVGPGLGAVGPHGNYAFMPGATKLLLAFFMILGRLELYAVVVLFVPRFWRR